MLSFPLTAVREVIARGRADAEAHGGFRNPYYGLRHSQDEQPGPFGHPTQNPCCP